MFVNLHSKLDNLKTRNHSLGKECANRDSKIEALEKDIKVKEEDIQNINRGFTQKVCNFNDKLKWLEKEKKAVI